MTCNHSIDSRENRYDWVKGEPCGVKVMCGVCGSSWFLGRHGSKPLVPGWIQ